MEFLLFRMRVTILDPTHHLLTILIEHQFR